MKTYIFKITGLNVFNSNERHTMLLGNTFSRLSLSNLSFSGILGLGKVISSDHKLYVGI